MRWNSRLGIARGFARLIGQRRESVIQDVDIPIGRAEEFLEFFQREIGILPIWICPIAVRHPPGRFPLYPLQGSRPYVNFGFWDAVKTRSERMPGHFNRMIERKVTELGGIKSLYSDSFYTREEFDAAYGGTAWRELKAKYDPANRLRDLYEKCVLRK
jgi:FAD/FMN-containing dehydrogenase